VLFHTWLTLSAAARQKPRRISPDAATHAISQIGFGNRQYESGAAGVILPSEVFLAWHSAFLFRREKFRERHSETHGNSGRRPDRVRFELAGIQITFAGPLGYHLYGVLRVRHELKQTLRF